MIRPCSVESTVLRPAVLGCSRTRSTLFWLIFNLILLAGLNVSGIQGTVLIILSSVLVLETTETSKDRAHAIVHDIHERYSLITLLIIS